MSPVSSVVSEGWFPVSFEQQLLLDNAEEKPPSHYNIVYGYLLRGSFDPESYAEAVRLIASSHESLRMVFRSQGARHVQRVLPQPAETVVERFSALEADGLQAFFTSATEQPIDIEAGPLFSCGLAPLAEGAGWALFHRWHHGIVDAWSVGLVTQQLAAAYNALLAGRAYRPEVGPRPRDIVQTELQAADRDPESGAYWAGVCEGAELLRFGPERGFGTPGIAGVVVRRVDLGGERMRALTRKTGFGASALFLASALSVAELEPAGRAARSAQSGPPKLLISILGLRTSPELRRFVGLLMRVVPLSVAVSSGMTGAELMGRVQSATLGAWAHRREPLGLAMELYPSVVEALGGMPMPLLVQLLDVPDRVFAPERAEAEEVYHGFRRYTRFDVELQIRPRTSSEFEIALVFDEELAPREHFDDLLETFVAQASKLVRSAVDVASVASAPA